MLKNCFLLKPAVKIDLINIEKVPEAFRTSVLHMIVDPEFLEANSLRDQMRSAIFYLRSGDSRMSYEQIGDLFNISRHVAYDQIQKKH